MSIKDYPWLYLRNDQPVNYQEDFSSIMVVGDITTGRGVATRTGFSEASLAWLRSADITMGNLEGVIAPTGYLNSNAFSLSNPYLLIDSPASSDWLRGSGFDLLGLANNHAQDLGDCGLGETIEYLDRQGIRVGGIGLDVKSSIEPVLSHIGKTRLAFFFFSATPLNPGNGNAEGNPECPALTVAGWDNKSELLTAIRSARQIVDVIVLYVHWGNEYQTRASFLQKEIAYQLVDAGADLVVGHHPHVTQEMQILDKPDGNGQALILYSLGNFLFDQEFEKTVLGMAGRILVDDKGIRGVQILPVHAGLHPSLFNPQQAVEKLDALIDTDQIIAYTCDNLQCLQSVEVPAVEFSGEFWSGLIDLTGDQVPEQVQRQGGRIIIYQAGKPAWQSPESWRIVDVALGDPDQDGRNEILMAFLKPDSSEVLRSHPFIIGYRGGLYRTLWGGSAVSDAILEIELADIDGDNAQELIVLDQARNSNYQTISVWQWHGWGFGLEWRSPEGLYEDLGIVSPDGNSNRMIMVKKRFSSQ